MVNVIKCSIEKSCLEWQDLESVTVEDGYLMEYFESENFEETGEVVLRKVGTEKVTKADEERKRRYEEHLERCENGEYDDYIKENEMNKKGIEEFDSFNDYFEEVEDENIINFVSEQLLQYKSRKSIITGMRIREMNKNGYRGNSNY